MLWKSAQWGSWMQVLFYFAINLQGKLTEASPWPFQICKRRRWDFLKFGPAQDFNSRTVLSPALSKIVQSFFQGVAAGLIYPTWPLVVQSCCLCSSIKSCFVGCWIWMDMRYIMVCIYIYMLYLWYIRIPEDTSKTPRLFPSLSYSLNRSQLAVQVTNTRSRHPRLLEWEANPTLAGSSAEVTACLPPKRSAEARNSNHTGGFRGVIFQTKRFVAIFKSVTISSISTVTCYHIQNSQSSTEPVPDHPTEFAGPN